MKPVRVAVVGLGIGTWHLDSYETLPETDLVALCDLNEPVLNQVADKHGIAKRYNSFDKLLEDDDVEAVSICVPNHLHAPLSIAALEAGKHVLCEKPLANSLDNAQKMVDAAGKSGRIAMVAMKMRFTAEAQAIRAALDRGELGRAYYGSTSYWRAVGGIPGRAWFTNKAQSGGGCMIDNGVHMLDMIWYMMGCPTPVRISGAADGYIGPGPEKNLPVFDVDDFAVGLIHFDNGAVIHIDTTWGAFVAEHLTRLAIMGTKGGAALWPFGIYHLDNGKVTPRQVKLADGGVTFQFSHFAECIRTGRTPISDFANCLVVSKMLDGLYRGVEAGSDVEIN